VTFAVNRAINGIHIAKDLDIWLRDPIIGTRRGRVLTTREADTLLNYYKSSI